LSVEARTCGLTTLPTMLSAYRWYFARLGVVDFVVHVARLDEEDILVDTAGGVVGVKRAN
jgi:hypothetical protein